MSKTAEEIKELEQAVLNQNMEIVKKNKQIEKLTSLLSQPSGVSEEKIQFLGKRKFKFEFYDMSETSEVVEYDERSLFEVMNGYFQASGGLRYTKFHNCAIISNEAFKLILLDKSLSPQSEAVDVKEFIKFLDKNKIEYCGETFNKDELIFRFPLEKPTADEFYMLLTFTQVLAEFKSLHKTSK